MNILKEFEKDGLKKGLEQGRLEGLQQGIERGLQQGIEKGLQRGLQQGIEKERQAIALNLLDEGMPMALIVKATGLTPEQIQNLRTFH